MKTLFILIGPKGSGKTYIGTLVGDCLAIEFLRVEPIWGDCSMDKLDRYREILQEIVRKHAQFTPSHGQIEALAICDISSDNYLLIDTGWDNTGRVHAVVFHLRLVGDKIWLEVDGTTPGIVQELLERGVDKEDIVLGFYRPERRKIVDFSLV